MTIVAANVDQWARAWSSRDLKRYLEHYSDHFIPSDGLSLEEWKAQRELRLAGPSFIEIGVVDMEIHALGATMAGVSFKQRYRSNTFTEVSHKQLLLKWQDDKWRILQELELK